jgi:hypothetical protein
MYRIYDYYNNNKFFKIGFLMGAGVAFMTSGILFVTVGFLKQLVVN